MNYQPFELHTHSRHSDGSWTVPDLMQGVANYGYKGMAITDHNAVTGYLDATPELQKKLNLTVIPGIEWTTFYGHMLVLGCDRFVDWRFVEPDTIDAALEEIRSVNGVVGVAHPCEVGAPLMCGCNWEFRITRWDLVNYIEIWSECDPHARTKNDLAYPWYNKLLNEGHHLAVSAARDWHGPDKPGEVPLITATYLGLDGEVSVENALNALRAGRTYITLGPTMDISLHQDGKTYGLSETVKAGSAELTVAVGETERRELWGRHNLKTELVRLVANDKTVRDIPYTGAPVTFTDALTPGWMRIELIGTYNGSNGQKRIAISSPIYVTE